MSLDYDDDAGTKFVDDAEDEMEAAAVLARTVVDLEPLKDQVNKCRCTLFNGQRCIDQFTDAESDEIRYIHCYNCECFLRSITSRFVLTSMFTNKRLSKTRHVYFY